MSGINAHRPNHHVASAVRLGDIGCIRCTAVVALVHYHRMQCARVKHSKCDKSMFRSGGRKIHSTQRKENATHIRKRRGVSDVGEMEGRASWNENKGD